ncbi:MAG: efflux RND transporter periplasmic adaptor subunit [Halieaceae bacterium]|nr:efflux RND transporter periplasmic adaptor subunit [Halieaceae bacterium]
MLVFLCLLMASGATLAQSLDFDSDGFDCTIEPRTVAEIGSAEEGIIDEVRVKRGDQVKAGQVLAVLDSVMETLTVDLARVQAEQDVDVRTGEARKAFQQLERERAETLSERNILSAKELDEAEIQETIAILEVESANIRRKVAGVELAMAEARLGRRTIRSPVNGVVTEVARVPGEYIHEQSTLLTLAQIDQLNVEVFVPIDRYGEVRVGQTAVVEPVRPIGGGYDAVVEVIDQVFDAASGTFGVRLLLENPETALPAGIRCLVRFEAEGDNNVGATE